MTLILFYVKRLCFLVLPLMLCACSYRSLRSYDKPEVVVSTLAWASIVHAVVGDKSQIRIMIDGSTDPHEYSPSAADIVIIGQADIILANGGGYDDFMIAAGNKKDNLINAFAQEHLSDDADIHIFLNLPIVDQVAHSLADKLATISPKNSQYFLQRYQNFHNDLSYQQDRLIISHQRHRPSKVIHTEKIGTYMLTMAKIYDITPTGIGDDDREPTAQSLLQTQQLLRDHCVEGLVVNSQAESPRAKTLQETARKYAVPIIEISEVPEENQTYIEWISSLVQSILLAVRD